MQTETESQWELEHYPRKNRFMVTFMTRVQLMDGSFTEWPSRRFCLAENANQAREFFRLGELSNKQIWDGEFHAWHNLQAQAVPHAASWTLGCRRFDKDARLIA